MIEIPQVEYHVIVRLYNGKSIFGTLKKIVDGVAILETDRIGKINLCDVNEIRIVRISELEKIKKSFGLRY